MLSRPPFSYLLALFALGFGCQPASLPVAAPRTEAAPPPAPPLVQVAPLPPTAEQSTTQTILDEPPDDPLPVAPREPEPHPLDALSDEEVRARVKDDLSELGSMSLGRPSGGSLVNAVPMPADDGWVVVDASHAYGTTETVENLSKVIALVAEEHPGTPPLHIGHISGKHGGPLSPHLSHQAGRDVDLGYYYLEGSKWYQPANAQNLDVKRTWSLVRAIIVETDVEFILIDRSLHPLLRRHAEAKGESRAWLDDLFKGTPGRTSPLIRHTKGHATHMHVRFWNPLAQETARRCYTALIQEEKIKPPTYMVSHRAKKGDSLLKLAKQYGTTVKAIQRANGLRTTKIFAKRTYKIPRSGPAAIEVGARAVIPARRLPPTVTTPPPATASQPRAQL